MRSFDSRWARLTLTAAVAAALLVVTPAPAGAAAPPARDTSRFACPATLPEPFTDIDGSVHEQAIRCMALYGFINGTTSTTFTPGANVTRGQFASFLARALAFSGAPLDTADQGFTDVAGSVHLDAINALAAIGVINGTTDTTFAPNRPVTRAQGASMVARALELGAPLPAGPDAFSDDEGSVHEDAINKLAAVGVVGGVTSDHYQPASNVTRGAGASILARAQDLAVEAGHSFPVGGAERVLAALQGSSEVPGPGDPTAGGTVELVRTGVDGLLCFTWDIDAGLSSAPMAAHVHKAAAGAAGPILITLPTPTVAAGQRGLEFGCAPDLDQALIDEVFANPAGYYVNVHTGAFPDGAVRGQLSGIATRLGTLLSGSEEAPGPGEADGTGDATIEVLDDGTTICGFVFYSGVGAPTAAHVHKGAVGAAGPIVVTLPPFDAEGIASDGCVGGLSAALATDIAANPDDYYVNIHTGTYPDGAVRGQLEVATMVGAELPGAAEAPGPGDPDGSGEVGIDLVGDGLVCVHLTVRGIAAPTAAHIHLGAPGVPGPVVVELPTPIFNSVFDCTAVDPAVFAALSATPELYYVNVHNEAYPDGAVRGQLAAQAP
ncbi:MAG: CHRD domain-containing protein [Acidimicrobiales bacterium]